MNDQRSSLLKKLTKTLAVTVPALALSGFIPVISSAVISSAHAEHHGTAKHAEAESKNKVGQSEAEAEANKAIPEAEAEARKAIPEAEAEARKAIPEAEAKKY